MVKMKGGIMKKILAVSDDVLWEPIFKQFKEEMDSWKTELHFADFGSAFSRLEEDPSFDIIAVDLTNFELMAPYRINDPEYADPHPKDYRHPAVKLLRDIMCRFKHKKIVIGFWHNGFNEHNISIFKYKPDVICHADDLKYKLNSYLIDKYGWIRWDLRGPCPLPQITAPN
jgi:hypothetical protein